MIEIHTVVENEAGIHCRPSSEILMKRQEYPNCSISISSNKGDADLDSILSLISLGLAQGDNVTVKADGENEEIACKTLAELFAFHFDFPPNK
jgi:phosphocarrier protein